VSTSPTQLLCLLNSQAFLFFFIIADLIHEYGFQISTFGFSLNKENRSRRYVKFTEPIRLTGCLNRFDTRQCRFWTPTFCTLPVLQHRWYIKVILTTEILHFNRTVPSNSTKQGSTFTKIPLLFDYSDAYTPTYKVSKSRRQDPSQAIASSGLVILGLSDLNFMLVL
jgi:hypothetical protein